MSNVIIKVENLGKQYRLGEIGTGTLSSDLNRTWARLRGKEDPFAKIGEVNDRTQKGNSDFVWSLEDINFEVREGEVLGIIGRNGAGKSTLLKILSKVTAPTTGRIKIKGRIASLLEVGTGFHPELTGRENIFLNGAILGMTKTEIRSKFDEIVDFSGVERYIDTPVKRYSSGMYVRLAFAVAAFLEPEILIVDEVLAVGDAEFQKKCLGRMKDVSVNDGRTVLFVSHNMTAVKQLCTQGIILKNGNLEFSGSALGAIDKYNSSTLSETKDLMSLGKNLTPFVKISSVVVNNENSSPTLFEEGVFNVKFKGMCVQPVKLNLEVRIYSNENVLISFYSPGHINNELVELKEGEFIFEEALVFPRNMANGDYFVNLSLAQPNVETYFELTELVLIKEGLQTEAGRALSYSQIGFFMMERADKI